MGSIEERQKRSDGGLGLALRALRKGERGRGRVQCYTGFIEEKQKRSGGVLGLTLGALGHHAPLGVLGLGRRLGVGALAGGLGRLLGRGLGLAVFFFGALAWLGTLKLVALRKGGGWRLRADERSGSAADLGFLDALDLDALGAASLAGRPFLAGLVASAPGESTPGDWLQSSQAPSSLPSPAP